MRAGPAAVPDRRRTHDQVLGQPTAEPLANGPVLETLSISTSRRPARVDLTSGTLAVQGLSNSFEANVIVTLEGDGRSGLRGGCAGRWLDG